MTLVAGVDTSTQSCKVLVFDAESGALIRQGSAKHPDATECHPDAWWAAFEAASAMAGGLGDVAAGAGSDSIAAVARGDWSASARAAMTANAARHTNRRERMAVMARS